MLDMGPRNCGRGFGSEGLPNLGPLAPCGSPCLQGGWKGQLTRLAAIDLIPPFLACAEPFIGK